MYSALVLEVTWWPLWSQQYLLLKEVPTAISVKTVFDVVYVYTVNTNEF